MSSETLDRRVLKLQGKNRDRETIVSVTYLSPSDFILSHDILAYFARWFHVVYVRHKLTSRFKNSAIEHKN